MNCPICGYKVWLTVRHMELSASYPLLERYYVCKRPADEFGHCGWSGKTREEYVTTLSPSGYGHIDTSGRIIKYLPDPVSPFLHDGTTKTPQMIPVA